MRKFVLLLMLGLALIGFGCSDENPDAPAGGGTHPMDGSFVAGSVHGPVAKADLTFCQACHAEPGGPGSNPRFNVGIDSQGGVGCEACHPANAAHPANWAGPNATFHYSAGNIQQSCTLCHGAALDGVGAVTGAELDGNACLDCHAETSGFTLDCTACHEMPPDAVADDLDVPLAVDHGTVANISSHDVCVTCHGMKEDDSAAGTFLPTSNYDLFDAAADTNGDHWDGNINMNSGVGYDETQWGCNACHGIDGSHELSDSGLPVVSEDYGGGSAPHALDGSFLNGASHGPAAEARDASFPNGLLDCQDCHAEAGTDNPQFNVGINSAGGSGCESCHGLNTAHPVPGGPLVSQTWYDTGATHSDIALVDMEAMCILCHDLPDGSGPASGGVGPSCASCHPGDVQANPSGCVSCHNLPPDGNAPAGNVRPNRDGEHTRAVHAFFDCGACHFGVGFGTADHFDDSTPASVDIHSDYDVDGTDAIYDPGTGNCTNVSCHGSDIGNTEGPWY